MQKPFLFFLLFYTLLSSPSKATKIKELTLNLMKFPQEVISRFPERYQYKLSEECAGTDIRLRLRNPPSDTTIGNCLAQVAAETQVSAKDISVIGGEKIIRPELYEMKITDMKGITFTSASKPPALIGTLTFLFESQKFKLGRKLLAQHSQQ